eukprot:m51a1_g5266 hypothetical protein (2044) ;mRNA; r:123702-129892
MEELWASEVVDSSSTYGGGWDPSVLLGPPRVYPKYGDCQGAWAPAQARGTHEHLALRYPHAVFVLQRVEVYETNNPGHVVRVSVRHDPSDAWTVVWEGPVAAPLPKASRVFAPQLRPHAAPVREVRVDLDCTKAESWAEIDCIRLVGLAWNVGAYRSPLWDAALAGDSARLDELLARDADPAQNAPPTVNVEDECCKALVARRVVEHARARGQLDGKSLLPRNRWLVLLKAATICDCGDIVPVLLEGPQATESGYRLAVPEASLLLKLSPSDGAAREALVRAAVYSASKHCAQEGLEAEGAVAVALVREAARQAVRPYWPMHVLQWAASSPARHAALAEALALAAPDLAGPRRWALDDLLATALRCGNAAGAAALALRGADPFAASREALFAVAERGTDDDVAAVLRAAAASHTAWLVNERRPRPTDQSGPTPFHAACANPRVGPATLEALVAADRGKSGAPAAKCLVNEHAFWEEKLCTPLALAVAHASLACVEALVARGAAVCKCAVCTEMVSAALTSSTTVDARAKAAALSIVIVAAPQPEQPAPAQGEGAVPADTSQAQAPPEQQQQQAEAQAPPEQQQQAEAQAQQKEQQPAGDAQQPQEAAPAAAPSEPSEDEKRAAEMRAAVDAGDGTALEALLRDHKFAPEALRDALVSAASGAWRSSPGMVRALLAAGAPVACDAVNAASASGNAAIALALLDSGADLSCGQLALPPVSRDLLQRLLSEPSRESLARAREMLSAACGAGPAEALELLPEGFELPPSAWIAAAGSHDPAAIRLLVERHAAVYDVPDTRAMLKPSEWETAVRAAINLGHPDALALVLRLPGTDGKPRAPEEVNEAFTDAAATAALERYRRHGCKRAVVELLAAGLRPTGTVGLWAGVAMDNEEVVAPALAQLAPTVQASLLFASWTSGWCPGAQAAGVRDLLSEDPRLRLLRQLPLTPEASQCFVWPALEQGCARVLAELGSLHKTVEELRNTLDVRLSTGESRESSTEHYASKLLICRALLEEGSHESAEAAHRFSVHAVRSAVVRASCVFSPALLCDGLDLSDQHVPGLLHDAAVKCEWPFVLRLLDLGARVREESVFRACDLNAPEQVVRLLLERCPAGANARDITNGSLVTPLFVAPNAAVAKALLDSGANADFRSGEGKPKAAEFSTCPDVVAMLAHRPTAGRPLGVGGAVLQWAVRAISPTGEFRKAAGMEETWGKVPWPEGGRVGAGELTLSGCGYHAAHLAAREGTCRALQAVLGAEGCGAAAYTAQDPFGNTVLHYAIARTDGEADAMAAWLLGSGRYGAREATELRNSEGQSPLRLALDKGDVASVLLMTARCGVGLREVAAVGFGAGHDAECDAFVRQYVAGQLAGLRAGDKYADADFAAGDASLWKDPAHPPEAGGAIGRPTCWRRASELAGGSGGGNAALFAGPPSADQIEQGALGTCYLLAALASVVSAEGGGVMRGLLATGDAELGRGVVGLRMYSAEGRVAPVVTDDQLPCAAHRRRNDARAVLQPLYAHSSGRDAWYVALVEKAYVKYRCGCYEAADGGAFHVAVTTLVGGSVTAVDLGSPEMLLERTRGNLWPVLNGMINDPARISFLSCSIQRDDLDDAALRGLLPGHAYAVVALLTLQGRFHLVRMYNPYGDEEWTGDWGDSSARWTPALKQAAGVAHSNARDGLFHMEFEGKAGFLSFFSRIEICSIPRSSFLFRTLKIWSGDIPSPEHVFAVKMPRPATLVAEFSQKVAVGQISGDELTLVAGVLPFDRFDEVARGATTELVVHECSAADALPRWLHVLRKLNPTTDSNASLEVCMPKDRFKFCKATMFFFVLRRTAAGSKLVPLAVTLRAELTVAEGEAEQDAASFAVSPVTFSATTVDLEATQAAAASAANAVKAAPVRGRGVIEKEVRELRVKEQQYQEENAGLRQENTYLLSRVRELEQQLRKAGASVPAARRSPPAASRVSPVAARKPQPAGASPSAPRKTAAAAVPVPAQQGRQSSSRVRLEPVAGVKRPAQPTQAAQARAGGPASKQSTPVQTHRSSALSLNGERRA